MDERQQDFYQKLRTKLRKWVESKEGTSHKWAEYLMFAPDLFHLLCKLSIDERVPSKEKAKLVIVLAYFISPLDIIPEAILGPAGYVDDIALSAYVLNGLLNHTDPALLQEHWAGEEDVLDVIKKILHVADTMVGKGLWNKLKGRV